MVDGLARQLPSVDRGTDERLFLKAGPDSGAAFEQAGCEPFMYGAKGKAVSLGYWSAPAEAMDSPALMANGAQLALQAALQAARTARAVKARAPAPAPRSTSAAAKTTRPAARQPRRGA